MNDDVMSPLSGGEDRPPQWLSRALAPGPIAGSGHELWIADVTRPVVAVARVPRRTEGDEGSHGWSWAPSDDRTAAAGPAVTSLCPDGDGCIAGGGDGIVRLHRDGRVTRLTVKPVDRLVRHRGLIAATSRPDPGWQPGELHLIHTVDDTIETFPLPGVLIDVTPTDDGFLAVVEIGRSGRNAYNQFTDQHLMRLTSTEERLDAQLGPSLDTKGLSRAFRLVNDVWLHDATPQPGTTGCRYAAITAGLTLERGPRAPRIVPARGMPPFWTCDNAIYAATAPPSPASATTDHSATTWVPWDGTSRAPAPPPQPVTLCALQQLDPTTLESTATLDLPWVPDGVTATSDGTVWVAGRDRRADPRHGRRPVLRWKPGPRHVPAAAALASGTADPVDLADILDEQPRIALVAPPVPYPELREWMYDRAFTITEALGQGGGTIDPIGFALEGDFPDTDLILTFHPQADPDILAAMAIPLFTSDGYPRPLPGPFADIALHEKMNTGGLNSLRSQQPDDDGLVWLVPRTRRHPRP